MEKKLLLFVSLTLASLSFLGQDVNYLDSQLKETKKRHATYVREFTRLENGVFKSVVKHVSGSIKCEGIYVMIDNKVLEHGDFVFYHTNGEVESKGRYQYGVKVGTWERYTASGARKTDRYYDPESADMIRNAMSNQ